MSFEINYSNTTVISPALCCIAPLLTIANNFLLKWYLKRVGSKKLFFGEWLYAINTKFVPYTNGELTFAACIVIAVHVSFCIAVGITNYYGTPPIFASTDPVYLVAPAIGRVSLMNYWLGILPSAKTSFFLQMTGVPFERAVKFHKGLIILGFCCTVVHFFTGGLYARIGNPPEGKRFIIFGFISLVLVFSLIVVSSDPIRKLNYSFFKNFHLLAYGFILTSSLHPPIGIFGYIPGIILHGIDWLVRGWALSAAKSPVQADAFSGVDGTVGTDVVHLKLPCPQWANVNKDIPLGGYFFLAVPNSTTRYIEWHPFSVSGTDPEKNAVTFHIQALSKGSFTRNLFEIVKASNTSKISSNEDQQISLPSVALYGPFGGLSLDIVRYQTVVLVCGGVGITPMLHILAQLLGQGAEMQYPFLRRLYLVWAIRDGALQSVFADRLNAAGSGSNYSVGMAAPSAPGAWEGGGGDNFKSDTSKPNRTPKRVSVHYDIYCTGKQSPPVTGGSDPFMSAMDLHGISVNQHQGRPVLNTVFEEFYQAHAKQQSTTGDSDTGEAVQLTKSSTFYRKSMCVLVCGTSGLSNQAYEAAIGIGVDFHKETFGY